MPIQIETSTFKFLKNLRANNNRDWFTKNKPRYQTALENVKEVLDNIKNEVSHHDEVESHKLYRIYRDVRFSKDKTPYKSSFSAGFTRATKWKRGGMFISISPGNSLAAGGFWNPDPKDLKRIRQEIAADDSHLRKLISKKGFKDYFGGLAGDQVKSAPKGYKKDHPAIDLLRYKQFLVYRHFTDKEVCSPTFAKEVSKTYKAMRPFFDYMSDVLTTDENGVRIEG